MTTETPSQTVTYQRAIGYAWGRQDATGDKDSNRAAEFAGQYTALRDEYNKGSRWYCLNLQDAYDRFTEGKPLAD